MGRRSLTAVLIIPLVALSSCGDEDGTGPLDTTPPAAVVNLATGGVTSSSIQLTWSAPGDDGDTGRATEYDIRLSTGTITESDWTAATQCSGEPTPKAAGDGETFTVTGLFADTTYFFALKTADEAGNWSELSNVASDTTLTSSDIVPPSRVTDLEAGSPTSSSVHLTWGAPGDDGAAGTATAYDIRYSTSEMTESSWESASQCVGEPGPMVAGTQQTFAVAGLTPNSVYCFALRACDEAVNWSPMSNVATARTEPGPEEPWKFCVVDSSIDLTWSTAIAVDSGRKVHIAYYGYYDESSTAMKYATNASSSWQSYVLINGGTQMGRFPSIGIDSNDKEHISYQSATDLGYANNSSGSWEFSTVHEWGSGCTSSLEVDPNDRIHISYADAEYFPDWWYLRYATNESGTWAISTVDSMEMETIFSLFVTSLALDSQNKAHIACYYVGTSKQVKYATNASGPWQVAVIDTCSNDEDVGISCSIVVDSSDRVHICYYDTGQHDLKHVTYESGSWEFETIDSGADVGYCSSMAIDSDDALHVAYFDGARQDLKYATNGSGSWQVKTMDSAGYVGHLNSICVDADKNLHIAYGASSQGKLVVKYTTNRASAGFGDDIAR